MERVAIAKSLADEAFLVDPAFADPWPAGHPATVNRKSPAIGMENP